METLLDSTVPVWALLALAFIWTFYYIGRQMLTAATPAIKRHPYVSMWIVSALCIGFAAGNHAAHNNGQLAAVLQIQVMAATLGMALGLFLVCRALFVYGP